jgi:3-oxoacyl-[acyl-carrier protein] reductase
MTNVYEGRFAGQVAIVTGGGSGIGAAVVARLAAEGCRAVHVVDVNGEGAAAVAQSLPAATAHTLDVTDAAAVDELFAGVVARDSRVDVLVHCAGVDDPAAKRDIQAAQASGEPVDVFRSLDDAAWRRLMSVNLDGTFHVLRACANAMVPNRSGAIVTIGSSAAFDTLVGYGHYAASKAGVHALSQSVAKELAAFGVRVNTVAPGPVDTPMAGRTPDGVRASMAASGAAGYASAAQLADTICYLASDGASNVVGAVLLSNGGRFTV